MLIRIDLQMFEDTMWVNSDGTFRSEPSRELL